MSNAQVLYVSTIGIFVSQEATEPRKGHRTVFLSVFLSRYHKIVSYYHKLENYSHKLISYSHKIVSCSHKLTSRYHKILSQLEIYGKAFS